MVEPKQGPGGGESEAASPQSGSPAAGLPPGIPELPAHEAQAVAAEEPAAQGEPRSRSLSSRLAEGIKGFESLGIAGLVAAIGPGIGVFFVAFRFPELAEWLRAEGQLGLLWIVVGIVVTCTPGALPTHAFSALAGYVFGLWTGTAVTWVGAMLAALLGHAVSRQCFGRQTAAALAKRPRFGAVVHATASECWWRATLVVLLIRLSPILPFAATNVLLGSMGVRRSTFAVGTGLGLIPRVASVAGLASAAERLNLSQAGDRRLFVLGIVATLAALVAIAWVARRTLAKLEASTKVQRP